ncbi:TolC family protein [Negadavirga shengliensis]|uniref:TolC family protein n=1 Tax=Negadavirga shengliensis TaxID=1389218 RepID=A0ABV9T3Z4_9BACT
MINVKFLFIGTVLLALHTRWAPAQHRETLTIEVAVARAEEHYPLVRQYALIEQSRAYSVENASKGYFPQASLAGQASYQSDVTRLPFSLTNMEVPVVSRDQYRIYGEVVQPITDVFRTIPYRRNLADAQAEVDKKKLEVELYQLRDRVQQLFFGILLIDAQLEQTVLSQADVRSGMEQLQVAVKHGAALQSSMDLLRAESLKLDQKTIELASARKSYLNMLGSFTNLHLDETTAFEIPVMLVPSGGINRPELALVEQQKRVLAIKEGLLRAAIRPRFSLFFQGGYGRPALNMLNNDFDLYYIGGLRLNWNLSGFYTYKNERQALRIHRNSLDLQAETFLFNADLSLQQQGVELGKLQELMVKDREIIALRESIKGNAQNQLANGTITAHDYVKVVHEEDRARQEMALHRIQYLMAQYKHQFISGD